ncbi:hypothetical protein [Methanoculleus sp.]|uniref:hypothetical protein n=1 Tax=Methanoculleus sp. TaxID=90427 RepID=UPI001BD45D1A|nr:hypothetical protein [Methanoculleus sp.]
MIRELVFFGGATYLVIALVQWLQNQTVRGETVVLAAALMALSLVHRASNEERLKRLETAGLWLAVALFVGYALAKAGGYA